MLAGLVNGIFFNQGQVCCAGSRLLVQEDIYDEMIVRLKRRMATLRVGHSLDKCVDMAAIADPVQHARVQEFIEVGLKEGADIFQVPGACPEGAPQGAFFPPTLVTNVGNNSSLVQEEIFGPVLVAQSFRKPTEARAPAPHPPPRPSQPQAPALARARRRRVSRAP